MPSLRPLPFVSLAAACLLPSLAVAAPAAEAGGSASITPASADASGDAKTKRSAKDKRKHLKWIKRWAPERNMGEVGVYGGILVPSRSLELFEAERGLPDQGFKQFERVAPDFGLRLGYYPIRFFGLEVEGGPMLAETTAGQRATMWTARGHFVAQLGLASITPFVLIGAGALGVASDRAAVGNDVDASIHFGGGLKFFVSRYVALRLDVRDIITAQRGVRDGVTNNLEVLAGLSLTFGRKDKPKPGP